MTFLPRREPALDALKVVRSRYLMEKATGGASQREVREQSMNLMGRTRPVEQASILFRHKASLETAQNVT